MTTQHTPGSWVVDPDTATATVRSASGTSVARCYQGDVDARLIAAAPDLLAQLQYAASILETHVQYDDDDDEGSAESIALEGALAAIAKATTNH